MGADKELHRALDIRVNISAIFGVYAGKSQAYNTGYAIKQSNLNGLSLLSFVYNKYNHLVNTS